MTQAKSFEGPSIPCTFWHLFKLPFFSEIRLTPVLICPSFLEKLKVNSSMSFGEFILLLIVSSNLCISRKSFKFEAPLPLPISLYSFNKNWLENLIKLLKTSLEGVSYENSSQILANCKLFQSTDLFSKRNVISIQVWKKTNN